MSVIVLKSAPSPLVAVKSALSGLGALLGRIAAAGAVSAAVENHRQPKAADLAALGLEGVDFKRYY